MDNDTSNVLKNMSGMGIESNLIFLKNVLEYTGYNVIVVDIQGEFDHCNNTKS